jgi:hypothetical protein
VTLLLEPSSECEGARLSFDFVDGPPVGGLYGSYGSGEACNRSGVYAFEQ